MSQLKSKSEINFTAAKHLLDTTSYFPTVVHSSYYSCIQLIKHILVYKMGISEQELDNKIQNDRRGSHDYMINRIKVHLIELKLEWRDFDKISQLKKLRTEADYKDITIDFSKGRNSVDISLSVLNVLKKIA